MTSRHARSRDERGAAAILIAVVTCAVLFVVAALTVDLGNTWARRGSLQYQVDRAAKFAAESLPVDSTTITTNPTATQLKVAKAAAYYIACHTVPGQSQLTTLPSCPSVSTYTTDSGIATFANTLLTNGRTGTVGNAGAITFPTVNQVKLTTPKARVSFGFGKVTDSSQSIQSATATAIVLSPGNVLPVGMSATCIANAVGAGLLGTGDYISKVMPINYLSTGYPVATGSTPVTPAPFTPGDTDFSDITSLYNNHPASINLNTASSSVAPNGTVSISLNWTSGKAGFTVETIRIYIRKIGYVVGDPTGFYVVDVAIPLLQQSNLSGTVSVQLNLPAGDYEAMVRLSGRNGSLNQLQNWINNPNQNATFTVPATGAIQNLVTCARPANSPRLGFASTAGDSDAMAVNMAQGLDHGLAAFPGLVDALDNLHIASTTLPANVGGLVSTVNSTFTCGSNSSVKLDYPTRREDGANCFYVDTTPPHDWATAVTQGLLTGGTTSSGSFTGRLKCPSSGQCNYASTRPTLTNPGGITGSYNNDYFTDFIKSGQSLLEDPFFMSLDTYLSPSIPLVTPPSDVVDSALYKSPRFFWAPVSLSLFTTVTPGAAGSHPILTFRPVFLTQETKSSTLSTTVTTVDGLLGGLVKTAALNGYTAQSIVQSFTDSALNLNPCSSLLSIVTILTSTLVSDSTWKACELAMLEDKAFSATTAGTTVSDFLTKYLGANIVTKDSANTGSFGGLVIDKSAAKVRAARIMTLAPGVLPAVPSDYSGPTTDYLGVGPKIIRLTK